MNLRGASVASVASIIRVTLLGCAPTNKDVTLLCLGSGKTARFIDIGTANRRPLSGDLDALDRAAGLANLAAGPTPVGEDASVPGTLS